MRFVAAENAERKCGKRGEKTLTVGECGTECNTKKGGSYRNRLWYVISIN